MKKKAIRVNPGDNRKVRRAVLNLENDLFELYSILNNHIDSSGCVDQANGNLSYIQLQQKLSDQINSSDGVKPGYLNYLLRQLEKRQQIISYQINHNSLSLRVLTETKIQPRPNFPSSHVNNDSMQYSLTHAQRLASQSATN